MPVKAKAKKKPLPARWIDLAAEFPLRPIRDDATARAAVAMIDRLCAVDDLTAEQEDYLRVLGDLVGDYEDEHEHDIEADRTPADMLRHLIEAKGVQAKDVSGATGLSEATISQVLTGRRAPSRRAIAALATYFHVDPSVFL